MGDTRSLDYSSFGAWDFEVYGFGFGFEGAVGNLRPVFFRPKQPLNPKP